MLIFLRNTVIFIDVIGFILVIIGVLLDNFLKLFESLLKISLLANGSIDEPGNISQERIEAVRWSLHLANKMVGSVGKPHRISVDPVPLKREISLDKNI